MCDPVSMLVTATAVQAGSSIMQGNAQRKQANADAAQSDYQAAVERSNAQAEATIIRRQGQRQRGETLSSIVASGVKVGQGSALDAERQVMQDASHDEYMALLTGERRAAGLNQEASMRRRAGRDAQRAGQIGAFTSLLSAGGNYAKSTGWKGF
jgi:hypothetical protein